MSTDTHQQLANFIWSICNLLRGPYKRNEYRKVILPLTVLKRFDSILAPTKEQVLAEFRKVQGKSETVQYSLLTNVSGVKFYNTSALDFKKLLDDPNHLPQHLNSYISGYSENVRKMFERFKFGEQIAYMADKELLYAVIKAFNSEALDLRPEKVDNVQMGYVFEELIRIGAEQSNEEAGDHFTPREVIQLMVNLLLSDETDLAKSNVVKTIYDPTCGTGGMLSTAEHYLRSLNSKASPHLFGQDFNDESWAVCKSDMLIKGENADNIILGDTLKDDGHAEKQFDYMLANPPFGVEWKQQLKAVEDEHVKQGYNGRFGAGLPRINDGAFLFLQHMLSKMRPVEAGGSRIAIVFNGSPLFTGDAGSGESEIRRWIIENDWLEGIVALPDQLFYNTGISTYIWVLTNRKTKKRKGQVQLLDARQFFVKMRKSLGNKRNRIGDGTENTPDQIATITKLYGECRDGASQSFTLDGKPQERLVSKVFPNAHFGYRKITVERPLKLNFQASPERIARLDEVKAFANLATSKKTKNEIERLKEVEAGRQRQQAIKSLLAKMPADKIYMDRKVFMADLKKAAVGARDLAPLSAAEMKAILTALSERDPSAKVCTDAKGKPEPDTDLRDTESVPLNETIAAYVQREVLPHVPDAWVDESKTKVGYEVPLTREFYVYTPPRSLEEIEGEIAGLEKEILGMLKEITV
ncbi:MAG: N-6 DNA methylase [Flavobacteriales bacterium]|nr:N-6 DNA methylase [Flavobacteriales bacterium]